MLVPVRKLKKHRFMGTNLEVRAVSCTTLLLWASAAVVTASEEETALDNVVDLGLITVTSTPHERPEVDVPVAIGSVDKDHIQLGRQQLSLEESLVTIPGLFFQDQYNFAQDLRISIRGFGARSNFGIRGIKIITDGIPNTLPDGQSGVDDIDLGSIQRVEVIRGPSSSLYGGAAGGVINISTEDGPEVPFAEGRLSHGAYDFEKYQVKGGGQHRDLNYLGSLSYLNFTGYRDHAATENALLNTKFRYDFDGASSLTAVVNAVDSPMAQDPGALNAREVRTNRRQAASRNILYNAGEKLNQQKLGLVYRKSFDAKHELNLRNYYVWREFDNFLPFDVNENGQGGSVNLSRLFYGGGGEYAYRDQLFDRPNSLVLGLQIDAQRDERKRFANNFGQRGALTTNQDENVTGYGIYLQDELSLLDNLRLTLGARYDVLQYSVDDKIGMGSGSRRFDEPSPMAALLWTVIPGVNLYGNISTAFEPPTSTELANPLGPTGFNPFLEPQTATNYEIGVKGLLSAVSRYEFAVFHINVDGELVPFELSGSGQTFFENAGESTRNGAEASLEIQPFSGVTTTFTYTYSDFTFDRFTDVNGDVFDGNKIPGVPDNQFYAAVNYFNPSGFYASWNIRYVDRFFANSANSVETEPYTVSDLRLGYTRQIGGLEISPFFGINNMFNEKYNDNIRINANFGRFFEPAPEMNVYAGIRVRYHSSPKQ
jgi:iron complex outermembrane receptor protein